MIDIADKLMYFLGEHFTIILVMGLIFYAVREFFRLLERTLFTANIVERCGLYFPLTETEKKRILEIIDNGLDNTKPEITRVVQK